MVSFSWPLSFYLNSILLFENLDLIKKVVTGDEYKPFVALGGFY